jgi:hypothetical protein
MKSFEIEELIAEKIVIQEVQLAVNSVKNAAVFALGDHEELCNGKNIV